MTEIPAYDVPKARQVLTGAATALAVAVLVAVCWDGASQVAAVGMVLIAAAASSLASPSLMTAVANLLVGAGMFGTVAVLVATGGTPTGDSRWVLAGCAVPPLAALLGSILYAGHRLERDPMLDFERHTVVRAASTALVTVTLVSLALTIVDIFSEEPAPPPVVFLFVSTFAFVVALITERHRMSR